jgi:hypothetical protein
MPRHLALATAALALTLTGSAAAATLVPPPGPKVPIEHIGVSGAHFSVRSGTPGCYTGAGSMHHGYEVPRGATVVGLTAYVVDTQAGGSIYVELSRHNFATGGSYTLAKGNSVDGYNTTVDLKVNPGYTLAEGEGVNVIVSVPSGVCFKGAELHYLPPGVPANPAGAQRQTQAQPTELVAPDAAPTRR